MKWNIALALAVLFVGLDATGVKAQSITIDSNVTSKGSIFLNVKVTVPANWKIKTVELFAPPTKEAEGEGGYTLAKVNKNDPTQYSGTMKVPPATYDGYAVLKAIDPKGGTHYYFSAKENGLDASK